MEILACKPIQVTVINVISKFVYNASKAAFQIGKKKINRYYIVFRKARRS